MFLLRPGWLLIKQRNGLLYEQRRLGLCSNRAYYVKALTWRGMNKDRETPTTGEHCSHDDESPCHLETAALELIRCLKRMPQLFIRSHSCYVNDTDPFPLRGPNSPSQSGHSFPFIARMFSATRSLHYRLVPFHRLNQWRQLQQMAGKAYIARLDNRRSIIQCLLLQ